MNTIFCRRYDSYFDFVKFKGTASREAKRLDHERANFPVDSKLGTYIFRSALR